MFRRYLALVEDSVMVVLAQSNSYEILLSASYSKSGRRGTRGSHFKEGEFLASCFGTSLIVKGHTLRSANSQNYRSLSGENMQNVLDEIAKIIKEYLISSLGLRPCNKRMKHLFDVNIVVYSVDPMGARKKVAVTHVTRITTKTIGFYRYSLATTSKVSFDKFLMNRNSKLANLYLLPPGDREVK